MENCNPGHTDSGSNLKCAPKRTKKSKIYKSKTLVQFLFKLFMQINYVAHLTGIGSFQGEE